MSGAGARRDGGGRGASEPLAPTLPIRFFHTICPYDGVDELRGPAMGGRGASEPLAPTIRPYDSPVRWGANGVPDAARRAGYLRHTTGRYI